MLLIRPWHSPNPVNVARMFTFSGRHVECTIGSVNTRPLLQEFHSRTALLLKTRFHHKQSGTQLDALSAGSAAWTPVAPFGYWTHRIGGICDFIGTSRSHALLLLICNEISTDTGIFPGLLEVPYICSRADTSFVPCDRRNVLF